MKTLHSSLLLVLALLFTGCVTTNVTPLSGKTYAPVDPEEVALYLDEADIPGEYDKIAVIYARGDYAMTNESHMFKKVRKKAAQLGANGVLVQRVKEPNTGEKVANAFLGTGADRRGEMIAIYVRK